MVVQVELCVIDGPLRVKVGGGADAADLATPSTSLRAALCSTVARGITWMVRARLAGGDLGFKGCTIGRECPNGGGCTCRGVPVRR